MNKIFLSFLFALLTSVSFGQIKWMSLDEALKAQEKNPKKIMMDVYTDWCGPCKMLDKNTFQNKDVAEYVNKHYYAVKFDAENGEELTFKDKKYTNPGFVAGKTGRKSSHQFVQALGITGYPTMIFFDEKTDMIMPLVGYYTATQIEIYLKLFATNDYKTVNTKEKWEAHQANFKGEFK